jgi:hypothetical protein
MMHTASVLTLFTTDEFADWFASLEPAVAEEVATGIEIVEQLGPARAAPGSTEWLLWYQHPEAIHLPQVYGFVNFRSVTSQWLEHLGSLRFVSKLQHLSPEQARRVSSAIDHIRALAGIFRRELSASLREETAGSPVQSEAFERAQAWYREVLATVGLRLEDFPAHSQALRELSFVSHSPELRVIYGVDVGPDRALLILGERLDRSYYGDSGRRAERVWRQFLEGKLQAFEPAQLR